MVRAAHIIGIGNTKPSLKSGQTIFHMIKCAFELSFQSIPATSKPSIHHLDGMLTTPSISEPMFLEAHYIATKMNLFPKKSKFIAKTIDTCGASPISALLEAKMLIEHKGFQFISIVAGDAVSSLPTAEFLNRANVPFCDNSIETSHAPVAYIPHGYDQIAQWHIARGHLTRQQLAMACVLMSYQASRHPDALTRKPYTLQEVLNAKSVGKVTGLLECARRADGAAAVLVASTQFIKDHQLDIAQCPVVLGGGEASASLYPSASFHMSSNSADHYTSCRQAVEEAYRESKVDQHDIQFYGLYDCFPICLILAIEATGLAPYSRGGAYIESVYHKYIANNCHISTTDLPINTHGGLMCYGAPWATPAMYNIIESVRQLTDQAGSAHQLRLAPHAVKNALVFGNGGVLSASAVAILSNYSADRFKQ